MTSGFRPAGSGHEIGGDFWTMFEAGPKRMALFIADFSGHGIPAAINTFRLHTLISRGDIRALANDPAAMLTQMLVPARHQVHLDEAVRLLPVTEQPPAHRPRP